MNATDDILCLASMGIAALVTFMVMPQVARLATEIGALDKPGGRSIHSRVTPRIGGVGIMAGVIAGLLTIVLGIHDLGIATAPLSGLSGPGESTSLGYSLQLVQGSSMIAPETWFAGALGIMVMFWMGLADDLWNLPPRPKFLAQIVAAAFVVAGGGYFTGLVFPEFINFPLWWIGIPLTIFWLVGATNATNLLDGSDGLAGGISLITFGGCAVVAASRGDVGIALVAAVWAAACLGYLPHNWNPARIFMGDCGSQLLGFAQGCLVLLVFRTPEGSLDLLPAALFFALPAIDTTQVMLRRRRAGVSVTKADQRHLHHHLRNDLGFNAKMICAALWGFHLLAVGTAMWLRT